MAAAVVLMSLIGGLATAAVLVPYGWGWALLAAAIGGSLAAAGVVLLEMLRQPVVADSAQGPLSDADTDRLVAALRATAQLGRAAEQRAIPVQHGAALPEVDRTRATG
ncbi:MAG: hypothetical protein ACOYOJ_17650 [Alsobacter sp.]